MNIVGLLDRYAPGTFLDTLLIRIAGMVKIPLLAYVRPKVLVLDDQGIEMLIPLRRRTKNHLNSMYMGAIMIGADVAAAYYAAKLILLKGYHIDFVFKSAHAHFLRRPDGDVVFICHQGEEIRQLVEQAEKTGERQECRLLVEARVPDVGEDLVAKIEMVLSLKKRKK